MRSTAPILPQDGSSSNPVCPPMYSELFETDSSIGTPPSYKSYTSSVDNSNSDLLTSSAGGAAVASADAPAPVKPTKIRKGKKRSVPAPADTVTEINEC